MTSCFSRRDGWPDGAKRRAYARKTSGSYPVLTHIEENGMKLKNPMLVVTDLEKSQAFYREVLGLRVVLDFGANVTLTGGLCLQTRESWMEFLHKEKQEIRFGGCDGEIYLETEDLDAFWKSSRPYAWSWCTHPIRTAGGREWFDSLTRTAIS